MSEKRTPYYPPEVPGKPPWHWLTPEFFVERQRLLELPGAHVETPQGKVWDIREGGEGGPPQGSVVVVPEPPVYVVAGSHAQAEHYMRIERLDRRRLRYVYGTHQLLGVPPGTLLVYGTAPNNLSKRRVLDYAEAVGWKVERC